MNKILPDALQSKRADIRKRFFFSPYCVVKAWGNVENENAIIDRTDSQVLFNSPDQVCVMKNNGSEHAAILIDYGCEIHGDVRIVTEKVSDSNGEVITARFLIRFGESIAEAVTPVSVKGATNDHATRDTEIGISQWAAQETQETGFRYMYLELLDTGAIVRIKSLTGVLIVNDVEAVGEFESSDDRLNKIWHTAAYTVYLNMQEYLWDGIKRDRAVWFGDMNTEVETALAVFGDIDVVRKSLRFGYETTPLPKWMNGIPSYSFWWLINLYRVYEYSGDFDFLAEFREYIEGLVEQILSFISDNGKWLYEGRNTTFIDWSTRSDPDAQIVGFMGMLSHTLAIVEKLLSCFGDAELIGKCKTKRDAIIRSGISPVEQKIAAALMSLGGLADPQTIDRDYIEPHGAEGYSTFMGYSILNAKALAGNMNGAVKAMKDYWGAMLDMGATTFWEDFDISWTNSTPIDAFPMPNKPQLHGDFGRHCYVGLRLSLCHGWSGGPCPWLTKNVLGVNIERAGMRCIRIKPYLGDMEYVRGAAPTPYGPVIISHENRDGKIYTTVIAPKEIEIIYDGCIPK